MNKQIYSFILIGLLFFSVSDLKAQETQPDLSHDCEKKEEIVTSTQDIVIEEQENIEKITTSTKNINQDVSQETKKQEPTQIKPQSTCVSCVVYINEVFPNPSGSDDAEFIELYNAGDKQVVIENWSLSDSTDKKHILTGIISPKSFKTVLKVNSEISLNNTNQESVKLRDNLDNIIDLLIYTDAKEAQSYSKFENNFFWTKQVTKNSKNILKQDKNNIKPVESKLELKNEEKKESVGSSQKKVDITGLVISEIYPNPQGVDMAKEFIELFNSSKEKIDLAGLYLDDIDGGSPPFKFDEFSVIEPGDYLVLNRQQTQIALNNTEDAVRILDKDKTKLLEVRYEEALEDFSYSLVNNKYVWTKDITPGKENVLLEADEVEEIEDIAVISKISLEEAHETEDKTEVTLEGVVSVLPNVLGSQYFYVQDGVGMQVYMYSKDFGDINVGDRVMLRGEISDWSGGKRIKLKQKEDIVILSSKNNIINNKREIDSIDSLDVGSLITLSGEYISSSGSKITLDDGTGEIDIYIKPNTNIAKPKLKKQDQISVSGIIILYKDGYRILPRSQNDLVVKAYVEKEIIEDNIEDKTSSSTILNLTREITGGSNQELNTQKYLGISMVLSGLGLIGIYIRKKYVTHDDVVIQNSLDSL